jgi:anaerobic selenocysteine-containing dehydrogenase
MNGERKIVFQSWGNSTLHPYDLLDPKLMTKDRANYSQYANPELDDLLKKGSVEINPETARKIGIKDGDLIWVESKAGKLKGKARLFPGTQPNSIHIP